MTEPKKILIAGPLDSVTDHPALLRQIAETCEDLLDAVELVAAGSFDLIALVLSGSDKNILAATVALKEIASNIPVVLLAAMSKEPAAIRLTELPQANTPDYYLVAPVTKQALLDLLTGRPQPEPAAIPHPPIVTAAPAPQADPRRLKELEQLATVDELTSLKNRRYILEFARQIIDRSRTQNGRVTLMIFDIDDFKHYNDVYGHPAGDEILKEAAALMQRCCRHHDMVGRIGGDEFAVVFWDDPKRSKKDLENERRSEEGEHPTEPVFIANRFRRELKNTRFHLLGPEGQGVLTISAGLATFPRDAQNIDTLVDQADKALLEAKRNGKNQIYLVGKPSGDIANIH